MALPTLVMGASLKEQRYSHIAIKRLRQFEHKVYAFGLRKGKVAGVEIDTVTKPYPAVHTVTLYLNPKRQKEFYHYITSLHPERVIFNPGTENPEFYEMLKEKNIAFENACTLVLLATGQYE